MHSIMILFVGLLIGGCHIVDHSEQRVNSIVHKKPSRRPTRTQPHRQTCYNDHRDLKVLGDKDFLSLPNFSYRWKGRCRGHVLWSQRLALLTRFNPEKKWDCLDKGWSYECTEQIKLMMEKLINYEVVEIFGVKNLYEFTKLPKVNEIVRSFIARISPSYHGYSMQFNHGYSEEVINTFFEAIDQVGRRFVPYLAIKGKYYLGGHAVMAYKVSSVNGKKVICVKDPNDVNERELCQNYLLVQGSEVYFHREDFLSEPLLTLEIMSDDQQRLSHYIKASINYCLMTQT